MLRVPLLNKIYATIKQVNEAISTNKKTAFKTVVLVEFPHEGVHSVGFVTSEQRLMRSKRRPRRKSSASSCQPRQSNVRIPVAGARDQDHQTGHVVASHQVHHQPWLRVPGYAPTTTG